MKECCCNCKYYINGDCRRRAPQIINEILSDKTTHMSCQFPYVDPNQWCGEYQPKILNEERE